MDFFNYVGCVVPFGGKTIQLGLRMDVGRD